jgi:hypothetical protein
MKAMFLDQSSSGSPLGDWAKPVSVRRPGEARDIIHIAFDPAASLVRAYAAGCWSIDETERYLSALTRFVEGSRAQSGKARVLLDRRDVSVQSPEVAALLATANGRIFQPEDKIALVVDTSLAKVSLRKRMPHPGTKAFLSIDAAETWLRAFGNWH